MHNLTIRIPPEPEYEEDEPSIKPIKKAEVLYV
jgi:hypothetical protein